MPNIVRRNTKRKKVQAKRTHNPNTNLRVKKPTQINEMHLSLKEMKLQLLRAMLLMMLKGGIMGKRIRRRARKRVKNL